ncbi:MAG: ArsA-related P-loop ATPase [Candidatus Asgardarchaeia archaeon]
MKIIVTGKGGVGKTSITAVLSHVLSSNGYSVLAIDTDSVPNLVQSLGVPYDKASKIVPLTKNDKLVEERTGARPGESWGILFSLTPKVDDLVDNYGITIYDNLRALVIGSIDSSKEGCLCPAIALAKALLRYLLLKRNEVVIVDSEAGAEVFGRGLAEKFDLMLCVCEPTLKSMEIAKKLIRMAKELDIKKNLLVINKVTDVSDVLSLYKRVFNDESVQYHIVRLDKQLYDLEVKGLGVDKLKPDSIIFQDVTGLFKTISYLQKLKV